MKHKFFYGGVYSNWYKCNFVYKNKNFSNTEQAFMYEKAMLFNDIETAEKILKTFNPKTAKDLGRSVKNFNDEVWNNNKFDIMYNVNYEKYKQNENLLKELLKYENYVEASPYDTIWGIGMAADNPNINNPNNWKGSNLLGKVLDKVKCNLISK